jgi:hypothetical protein
VSHVWAKFCDDIDLYPSEKMQKEEKITLELTKEQSEVLMNLINLNRYQMQAILCNEYEEKALDEAIFKVIQIYGKLERALKL